MAWGARDVSERRMEFAIRGSSGKEEMKAVWDEFEISRPTGCRWVERYRSCSQMQDLAEISRRPQHSPAETPAAIQQRVIELRQQYPDWGARKLVVLLEREGIRLPRITAHRILLRQGLVPPAAPHPPAIQSFVRAPTHQLLHLHFSA